MPALRTHLARGYLSARLIYNGELRRSLRWFRGNEQKSIPEIRELQGNLLANLLYHSARRVPYYRQLFSELGLTPAELAAPDSLSRLPLLTKSIVKADPTALVADNLSPKQLIRSGTGGSTGMPVPFYRDSLYMRRSAALKWRNLMWTGWAMGEPRARIWGSAFDVRLSSHLIDRTIKWLDNQVTFPAFAMTEASMTDWHHQVRAMRPVIVEGYTNPLVAFTRYVREQGWRLDDLGVKGVINAAETLYEPQRRFLEESYGCHVFNRYGGRELSDIAHECRCGTLHLCDDWVVAEVVDADGNPLPPGVTGQIVLTGLHNFAMPFIRYAVEDVGALLPADHACPCGLPFRGLARVEGRIQDLIVLPQGGYVAGEIFPHLFKDFDVRRFQVVQEEVASVSVDLIAGPQLSTANQQYLVEKLQAYLPGVTVSLHLVDDIPATASGKFRFTVSKVAGADAFRSIS